MIHFPNLFWFRTKLIYVLDCLRVYYKQIFIFEKYWTSPLTYNADEKKLTEKPHHANTAGSSWRVSAPQYSGQHQLLTQEGMNYMILMPE